jgi:hypothetical protein
VNPASDKVIDLGQGLARTNADSLENLAHIAHVEGVMAFGRGRKHLLRHQIVYVQSGTDERWYRAGDVAGHGCEELRYRRLEDSPQAFVIERRNEDEIES